VAQGPNRQQVVEAEAPPAEEEGDQAVLAPVQAPQLPLAARTML
ncbi:hypothetical protein Tco_0205054, partial [Tanacetum coccineum]